MIRIIVNHDLIGIPQPAIHVSDIVRRDAEREPAEPKTTGSASTQMPNVSFADTAREMSMLPGMIQVVMCIVSASIMTHPLTIGVNMRRFRMSGFIVEFAVFRRSWSRSLVRRSRVRRSLDGSRPLLRNVSATHFWFTAALLAFPFLTLPKCGQADHQKHRNNSNEFFHSHLRAYRIVGQIDKLRPIANQIANRRGRASIETSNQFREHFPELAPGGQPCHAGLRQPAIQVTTIATT
jgi:hypothetical protein